jgi:transposase-like protein
LGVDHKTVAAWLPEQTKEAGKAAKVARAAELAALGWSARAIAKEVGVSHPTITAWLAKGCGGEVESLRSLASLAGKRALSNRGETPPA